MKVNEVFDKYANKYDAERRNLIPCFEDFYGIAIDVIDFEGTNPKVLDLGAGTGILSQFLLEKFPDAEILLVDLADEMLDKARDKFSNNPNISFRNENYITNSYDCKFDIIMSALSIHHLDTEEKKLLYEKCAGLLNEGGVFVNADLILESDRNVQELFYQKTDDFVLEKVGFEIFEEVNKRRKFDQEDTIDYQLYCLKNAGLRNVGVPYKFYNYAVLWAQK